MSDFRDQFVASELPQQMPGASLNMTPEMMSEMDCVTIPFKERSVYLWMRKIQSDIDIDRITTIDYQNLFAEIVTISVLLNRVGIMRADAESLMLSSKLQVAITKASVGENYRKSNIKQTTDAKGNTKSKAPTVQEIDNAVTLDEAVQQAEYAYIKANKEFQYMDSLYWAVKTKSDKIDKISSKMELAPEEFEKNIIEGEWNSILIRKK